MAVTAASDTLWLSVARQVFWSSTEEVRLLRLPFSTLEHHPLLLGLLLSSVPKFEARRVGDHQCAWQQQKLRECGKKSWKFWSKFGQPSCLHSKGRRLGVGAVPSAAPCMSRMNADDRLQERYLQVKHEKEKYKQRQEELESAYAPSQTHTQRCHAYTAGSWGFYAIRDTP